MIDIIIDDKGTTKRVAVDAGKLGIELDKSAKASEKGAKNTEKLSKSTKDLDRNMRGTAKMSSNNTKEFSKMSQGMGGLVGAYATLAAQVFAVSAAFQFLQSASNMRNLIEGQEAMGAITGTAYKTITNTIIAATDAQIKYADAAKAAAIGTAAGLDSTQLERLGEVAKNTSYALGRDMTDSFNRLVRGVTKAEPELLDELGIILRLDTATRKYADSIGVSVTSLTAFQRSQAVANEVLEQGETKFGAISAMMSDDAASLAQFTKSFDDLFNTIKIVIIQGLTPVLKFLSGNTLALSASLALFALPIIKSILPNLTLWRESQKALYKELDKSSERYTRNIENQSAAIKRFSTDKDELAAEARKDGLAMGKKVDTGGVGYVSGGKDSPQARAAARKGLKQAEADLVNHTTVQTGIYKKYNAKQVALARASYNARAGMAKKHQLYIENLFDRTVKKSIIGWNKMRLGWAGLMGKMVTMAVGASKLISLALSLAGLIGIISMVVTGVMAFIAYLNPATAAAKRQKEMLEELTTKYKDLGEEMKRARTAREDFSTGSDAAVNVGNSVQSAGVTGIAAAINEMADMDNTTDKFKELQTTLTPIIAELALINPEFKLLQTTMAAGGKLYPTQVAALKLTAEGYAEISATIKGLPDQISKSNQSFTKMATGLVSSNPLSQFLTNEASVLKGLEIRRKATEDLRVILYDELELRESAEQVQRDLDIAALDNLSGFHTDKAEARRKYFALQTEEERAKFRVEYSRTNRINDKGASFDDPGATIDHVGYKKMTDEMERRLKVTTQNGIDDALTSKEKVFREQEVRNLRDAQVVSARKALEQDILATENMVVGTSLKGKLQNLDQKSLMTKKKIVKAENSLSVALVHQNTLSSLASQEQKDNAQDAVDTAKQQIRLANALQALEDLRTQSKRDQILLEENLLDLKVAQINAELKSKGAKRLIAREELMGMGSEASSKIVRDKKIEALKADIAAQDKITEQAELVRASKRDQLYRDEANVLDKKGLFNARSSAGVFESATNGAFAADGGAVETQRIKGQGLRDELEAMNNPVALAQKSLEVAERQAQVDLNSFSLVKEHEAVKIRVAALNAKGIDVSDEELTKMKETATATEDLLRKKKNLDTVREGLIQGFAGAFEGIITGAKSAKEAFADMARGMLQMLAKIIAQELALKAVKAIGGFLPFADGGIMPEYAKGGYTSPSRKYGRGGTARGPQSGYNAVLHGNEAVVPLPDNRSIPVSLNGAGGQNNNVVVNVSMDGQGGGQAQTQGDSGQARAIGQMVASAVQQELQHQKRSGGILSPYGVS